MKDNLTMKASLATIALAFAALVVAAPASAQAIHHPINACVTFQDWQEDCAGTSGVCQTSPFDTYTWCLFVVHDGPQGPLQRVCTDYLDPLVPPTCIGHG